MKIRNPIPRRAGVAVVVEVDFGPAARTRVSRQVQLPAGSTALDVTLMAVPTEQGIVCCDPKNVFAIDGVACEPSRKLWWVYDVNGQPGPKGAHLVPVAGGDVILWKFMSEEAWRREKGFRSAPTAKR